MLCTVQHLYGNAKRSVTVVKFDGMSSLIMSVLKICIQKHPIIILYSTCLLHALVVIMDILPLTENSHVCCMLFPFIVCVALAKYKIGFYFRPFIMLTQYSFLFVLFN